MGHTARRLLTGPLLLAALATGTLSVPGAAAAATVTGTVQVGSTLLVRSGPSLAARAVGRLGGGARVTVQCAVTGQTVRGSVRTSDQWDRLGTGRYVAHAYVRSGAVPRCAAASPQAVPVRAKPAPKPAAGPKVITGRVRSAEGRVNVRSAPSTSAAIRRTLTDGAALPLLCGVVGESVAGTVRTTTQWNRLTDGSYVSHAYVVTPTLKLCPGASLTPPRSSASLTPEQFIAASVPGAQAGWREFGVPASVTIAQAILESGWGRSGLASVDRNYFGIKCFDGRYGAYANGCHVYRTQECTKAGNCFTTTATFRTYATQAHSFRDHGSFLRVNSRYKPAFAYTRDANRFIWQVWKAGYATDPNYYTKVTGIMASWDLYRYDTWS